MDIVWLAALAAMWSLAAGMAWALGRLGASRGERS